MSLWIATGDRAFQPWVCLGSTVLPIQAAEAVVLSYGFIQDSVSIDALEAYANIGEMAAALRSSILQRRLEQWRITHL